MSIEFKTEAELCAAFIEWVKVESGKYSYGHKTPMWTVYPETADWDILLVSEDGTQIGIEAKLKFNMKVLAQCMPESYDQYMERPGPDYRAVLVPKADADQEKICAALGLLLFRPANGWTGAGFRPGLSPDVCNFGNHWHDWNPADRCKLPDYLPDVQAGCPAPLRLTDWKVKALRILALIDVRGYVTKHDFKTHRVDPRAWVGHQGLLTPGAEAGQYVRGKADFDKQHPIVYAQVLEETRAAQEVTA